MASSASFVSTIGFDIPALCSTEVIIRGLMPSLRRREKSLNQMKEEEVLNLADTLPMASTAPKL